MYWFIVFDEGVAADVEISLEKGLLVEVLEEGEVEVVLIAIDVVELEVEIGSAVKFVIRISIDVFEPEFVFVIVVANVVVKAVAIRGFDWAKS